MTVERASELVQACPTPEKYDLFDFFYEYFSPLYEKEFGELFAELCGFLVARDVCVMHDWSEGVSDE